MWSGSARENSALRLSVTYCPSVSTLPVVCDRYFFILKLDSTFSPSSSYSTHTHAAWAVRNDGLGGRNPSPVFCKTLPLAGSHPPLTRTRPLPRAFSAGIVVTASKMKMELQFLAKALRDLVAASVVITAANSGARPAILAFVVKSCRSFFFF